MEWLLLFGIGLPLTMVIGAALWIRSLKLRALGEVLEHAHQTPELISESANCLGVESGGMGQIRGNGCLALTSDEVLFRVWTPARWVRVPRDAISEVSTPRSHLGKTKGVQLLKVAWTGASGPDSVAFVVRDLERWVGALQRPPGLPEHQVLDASVPVRETELLDRE